MKTICVYVHLFGGTTDSQAFKIADDATLEEIEEQVQKVKEELFAVWWEVQLG